MENLALIDDVSFHQLLLPTLGDHLGNIPHLTKEQIPKIAVLRKDSVQHQIRRQIGAGFLTSGIAIDKPHLRRSR
jgi:hypothetical protein